MEKENEEIIMEEIKFIDEESYQKFKKDICKINDYFTYQELKNFIAIFIATPKKSYKKI